MNKQDWKDYTSYLRSEINEFKSVVKTEKKKKRKDMKLMTMCHFNINSLYEDYNDCKKTL